MNKLNYKNITITTLFFAVISFSFYASNAMAENIIYPGDPNWSLTTLGNGNAEITAENPRSGNGSLALTTDTTDDWAFFSTYAGENISTDSWGSLADIDGLSFDWYRTDLGKTEGYLDYDPWVVQTPALRLLVRDYYTDNGQVITFYSELVWEKFYTSTATYLENEWINADLLDDNFWRHRFDFGYTISDGTDLVDFGTNTLMAESIYSWASQTADTLDHPYSSDAVVYGLSVGAGSYWPEYNKAYVDNIFLSFGNGGTVINDNFELPVPEPSTILLLGSGLLVFAARRKRLY